MRTLPLLIEIGTEEIPDWMIKPAVEQFRGMVEKMLQEQRLGGTIRAADATPRRIFVIADGVLEQQPDREELIMGPPKSAAYKDGKPTGAAIGFAKKNGVEVDQLRMETTPKGEYLAVLKKTEGSPAKWVLGEQLAEMIPKIYFPKTMYWTGKNGVRFIRPIRWIVGLLGSDALPLEIAGVAAGYYTAPHRHFGAATVCVNADNYVEQLGEYGVIVSSAKRRERILTGIAQLLTGRSLVAKVDDALLDTLVYLTEQPTPILGSFDPEYLTLPEEVLVTVMRFHQKYFSVNDAKGKLAPHFIAVMNIPGDPDGIVRGGNERVLRARFNDARFFWDFDQKKKLSERVADLATFTFQAKLGSYLDKTNRMKELVTELGGNAEAVRAAELSKCDLTTGMVKEFTELQGVVGGLYARAQGEPEAVAKAIYDHYKPVSMEDSIPSTGEGRIVALADKIDTLRGCFRIGLIPSGSKDPFALRRAAQGVVKILVEGRMPVGLAAIAAGDPALLEFLLERVRHYFKEVRGFAYDEMNAVLAAGHDDLADLEQRLAAIQAVRPTADFAPLAAGFKRIKNILRQANFDTAGGAAAIAQGGDTLSSAGVVAVVGSLSLTQAANTLSSVAGAVDPKLLEPGPEADLFGGFEGLRTLVLSHRDKKDYRTALTMIASLRPAVDLFFDKVLVNAPDESVRRNRLLLLAHILTEFSSIADFSEIVTGS